MKTEKITVNELFSGIGAQVSALERLGIPCEIKHTSDIDHNGYNNYEKCGWYFDCYDSVLYSGPPHNYNWPGKEYGPRKGNGKYVRTGDSVGVVMDTVKGGLSFVVNGMNLGVAYEGIPLDKPLVPCVLLYFKGDSVELII